MSEGLEIGGDLRYIYIEILWTSAALVAVFGKDDPIGLLHTKEKQFQPFRRL